MEHGQPHRTSRKRLLGGGLVAGLLLTATAVALQWQKPADPAARPPVAAIGLAQADAAPSASEPTPSSAAAVDDANDSQLPELVARLVGDWQMQRHGERRLSVRADGTATVEVQLNMLGAMMYGQQLTLELAWSLEDDVMTQIITSGTPTEAVQRLTRDWGDRRQYRVVDVSDNELVLSEIGDDGDRDVWTRMAPESASTASQTKQSPR